MQSSNYVAAQLAAAVSLALSVIGSANAQSAPTPSATSFKVAAPASKAPTTPAQASDMPAVNAERQKATQPPQAPGVSRSSDENDAATAMSLKEFAALERKKALISLRKQIKEAQQDEKKDPPAPLPQAMPSFGQHLPSAGIPPGMPIPPGMTPAMLARMGIKPPGMLQPLGPQQKVVSIISFRGDVSADIVDGELITTVRVGDRLGNGKVVGIDINRGVSVETTGAKNGTTVTVLPPAINMTSQSVPVVGIPNLPSMAPKPTEGPDATSVPMATMPPLGQHR